MENGGGPVTVVSPDHEAPHSIGGARILLEIPSRIGAGRSGIRYRVGSGAERQLKRTRLPLIQEIDHRSRQHIFRPTALTARPAVGAS